MQRFFTLTAVVILLISCDRKQENRRISGSVFGTSYSVIYNSDRDYQSDFDRLFDEVNNSMSTYIPDSDISRINKNEEVSIDAHFKKVFNASEKIFKATSGIFDPTIGAVVNAWDFGPEGNIDSLDSLKIKDLMTGVGFDKITLIDKQIRKPSNTYLDFNAIAKGYGVDVIGLFLESQGIEDYLVEIGGEIRTRGISQEKQAIWKVGIDRPNFDGSKSIFSTLDLTDASMATSGTYRKFKIDSTGNRYAHIIDTSTGYPAKTNVLSASVIAEDCMTADGFATAIQAMTIEMTEAFLKEHPELKVLLIYADVDGMLNTRAFNGFPVD
ncbi:MAG: FAD:protein FMN transferase [Bacteroidia bacterium]|nr:FAD:protein FMN transferase [Bacteroidia bacterium]